MGYWVVLCIEAKNPTDKIICWTSEMKVNHKYMYPWYVIFLVELVNRVTSKKSQKMICNLVEN
jgi:hypothetical protein